MKTTIQIQAGSYQLIAQEFDQELSAEEAVKKFLELQDTYEAAVKDPQRKPPF